MPASEKQRQLCETTQLQICLASLSGVFPKNLFYSGQYSDCQLLTSLQPAQGLCFLVA